jgi:23S rRNA (cytidine1920-2'-O)/16S rRNA (cytidine1409-2'-O)-methyltransferase
MKKATKPTQAVGRLKSSSKRRLDVAVVESAHVSRERAQALIMEGRVRVDGQTVRKPGTAIAQAAAIEVTQDDAYVSRGGYKLERALDRFGWSVADLRCLDVGASTGGFTHCLLARGAASVTALDVGYGQIAWKLRTDPRVTVIERCNFRTVDPERIGAPFAFACADVSFISLAKLAAQFRRVLGDGGRLVALVKPQFEAGRDSVGRGGVVRAESEHVRVLESVIAAYRAAGIEPVALTHSPLRGPAGNIEFLLGAQVGARGTAIDAAGVVRLAHETLPR